MKGIIEEYGTFIATTIVALVVLSYLLTSITSPKGAFHRFVVINMENTGAESQVVIKEWDINSIKVVYKDDGGLYFTGTGTLPSYNSVEETPWAELAGEIIFVRIEDGIIVPDKIPIE